jgi:hypothetical protein
MTGIRTLRHRWTALVAVAGALAAFGDVGWAADNGTVSADVTVAAAAACIQLSGTTVSFGTLPLGAVSQPGTPDVTITNCATTSGTLLVNGTDATAPNALWALDGSQLACNTAMPLGVDRYHLDLVSAQLPSPRRLSTLPQNVLTLAANQGFSHSLSISTACPGSSGAGQTMSMQVTYTATA